MDDQITFRALYIRPEGNVTGSFGVLPEDAPGLDAWMAGHGIETKWLYVRHPESNEQLKACRPVEGNQLKQVEGDRGIRHGQRCRVTFRVAQRGDQWQMSFVDAEKDEAV